MKKIEGLFDPVRRRLAEEYNEKRKKYNRITLGLNFLFWALFLGFSLEKKISTYLNSKFSNYEIKLAIYLLLFYLLYSFFTLILDYYMKYKLDRQYNLSNQNKKEWLIDEVKSFILGLVFFYLAVRTYLYFLHKFPGLWWIYYTIVASIFIVILTFIFPTVLLPIFFKMESYPESELKECLLQLIKKADVEIDDIYEINLSSKMNAANAAVMGIGSSRKVVLGDNLKDKYSIDEIETVLAHELGHQVHGDIFKNVLIQPIIILIISFFIYVFWPYFTQWYGYSNIDGIYTIPVLLLAVGLLSWFLAPIQLLLSRIAEKKADLYAVDLTGKVDSFASAMAKLADEGLSPLNVSLYKRLFKSSHPPIEERLKYIINHK